MERKRKLRDALDRLFSSPQPDVPATPVTAPAPAAQGQTSASIAPGQTQPVSVPIPLTQAPAMVTQGQEPAAVPPIQVPAPAPRVATPIPAGIPVTSSHIQTSVAQGQAPSSAAHGQAPASIAQGQASATSQPRTPPSPRPAPRSETAPILRPPSDPSLAAQTIELAKAKEEVAVKELEAAAMAVKPEHHLVVFQLAGQSYGVEIANVEGIIKMQPITTVPRTLAFVEGVTNLRGTVLPVFDLRKRFGLPPQAQTKDSRIITIQLPGNTAGIIVDEVKEVLRVPEDLIEPPPAIATTVDSSYLVGIANVNNQFVILLDLAQVLTTETKVVLPTLNKNSP